MKNFLPYSNIKWFYLNLSKNPTYCCIYYSICSTRVLNLYCSTFLSLNFSSYNSQTSNHSHISNFHYSIFSHFPIQYHIYSFLQLPMDLIFIYFISIFNSNSNLGNSIFVSQPSSQLSYLQYLDH